MDVTDADPGTASADDRLHDSRQVGASAPLATLQTPVDTDIRFETFTTADRDALAAILADIRDAGYPLPLAVELLRFNQPFQAQRPCTH